ncbi:putative peptidylprolyl isomerase [Bradyrhizobium sp. ORS 278]|uniref:peptidylprolyl isomerase n=1 Tax=Bradyrhizobium sp. (strain ORS 278) TaxID=114615 RepID=UPI0001507D55|nr:peptidyl-prolyl cis-trans isomerase [Bradyrhizobium sp. ORS 278]CAL76071.1 putative peptidylprolyl isomerase [Bradyrhizobium sp. ORS 278]
MTGPRATFLLATTLCLAAAQASAQSRTPAAAATPAPTRGAAPATPPAAAKPAAGEERGAIRNDEVVARVGDSDVTADEVRATIVTLDPRQQAALMRDPALLSQTVRAILANRLVLKEALAKKWDQQPAVVAQLARARESILTEGYLQSVTQPPDSYPSEADIKAAYEVNMSAFLVPRRFRIAQILVALANDADKAAEDAAKKKLEDVVRKLKQPGTDFAALARASSDETATAEKDGEIGWVPEPNLRGEIRSQVAGLAKGGVTDPIRLDDGWHVVKLLDTDASTTRPLAEVKDVLIQRLRAERADANRRAYVAELVKQTPSVVNEIALGRLFGAKPETAAK